MRLDRWIPYVLGVAVTACVAAAEVPALGKDVFHGAAEATHSPPSRLTTVDFDAACALLGDRFHHVRSVHYAIITDGPIKDARRQIQTLERTWVAYHRFLCMVGYTPDRPADRLIMMVFTNQEMYRAFAHATEGQHGEWIQAYYSPRHRWIVAHDVRRSSEVQIAAAALDEMDGTLKMLRSSLAALQHDGGSSSVAALRADVNQYERHLKDQRQLLDSYVHRITDATTVHEGIHQLAFETRLQSPEITYPLWLSEGLATAFETDQTSSPFGPHCEFDARRTRFQELLEADNLLELERLWSITVATDLNPEEIDILYHQSYAFFQWLWRHRPDDLRRLFVALRSASQEEVIPTIHRVLGEPAEVQLAFFADQSSDSSPTALTRSNSTLP